jgi:hypothetical protein
MCRTHTKYIHGGVSHKTPFLLFSNQNVGNNSIHNLFPRKAKRAEIGYPKIPP